MPEHSPRVTIVTIAVLALCGHVAFAAMPYHAQPAPEDPDDYAAYLFIDGADDLPASFDSNTTWYLSDHRSDDLALMYNTQELYGVRGMGVNRAWEVSTGRPDVVVAILDSGVRWNRAFDCNLLRKYFLNRFELPMPAGGPEPTDRRFGGYDVNRDGVFNIADYWGDPAVSDVNGNDWIDPEDLILLFSDGTDGDGNGYVDDIAGWDFFEGDNDPQDDVGHGHGANQAMHAAAEAPVAGEHCPADDQVGFRQPPGTCANCMILPLRVGDSFVADANHYAEAVIYAVDSGARVVENALGTLNHTSFAAAAVDYAYRSGVVVNASEADEAAGHHNWPAAHEHTVVHNSIRPPALSATFPQSYLLLNGCTNFGAYTHVTIPSEYCSSQATGLAAGVSGLLVSAALNAVDRGSMTPYVDDNGDAATYPLSPAEIEQLWRLAADDVDFSTPYPDHAFSELWSELRPWWWLGDPDGATNSYGMFNPLTETRRYQTVRGWDYFTGYGRINAARLVRYIGIEDSEGPCRELVPGQGPYAVGCDPSLTAQDRIPPEADITWPRRWHQYGHDGEHRLLLPDDPLDPDTIVVRGRAAANRVTATGGTFDYVLEWAPGAQGAPAPDGLALAAADSEETSAGPWTEAARVEGLDRAAAGELGRIAVTDVAAALAANPYPFALEGDPTASQPTERWAVRLRLRVLAHPTDPADTVNNEAVVQKQVDVYPAAELILRDDLGRAGEPTGGAASPSLHDVDGDGRDELIVPTDDGLIHAYTDVLTGAELPGWPVATLPIPGLPSTGDNAFTRAEVPSQVASAVGLGSAVVADLDDDGIIEVLAADADGRLYAWAPDGLLRDGFPVTVDYALSRERPCGPETIPHCDDYDEMDRRNEMNLRDWAFLSAPAVADLDPAHPGLEIVAAAADSHVYAWHGDGSPVPGWPVILRDPKRVEQMEPTTRVYEYTAASRWARGSKATQTPALGDLDGDGDVEVVAVVNEQYADAPNADFVDGMLELLLGLAGVSGNGRIYALHHAGAESTGNTVTAITPHTHDQAYVEGWPVPIATVMVDLLPTAGAGSNAQPALADIDGDGRLEVTTASHAGPGYVLRADGAPFHGWVDGVYRTLDHSGGDFGAGSTASDGPSLPALGGMALGRRGPGQGVTVTAGSLGLARLLDNLLPARQIGAEDHLGLWAAASGDYSSAAPTEINDMQFFATPVIADVTGDGLAEVLQQSSFSDLLAVPLDSDPIPVHTGGWHMGSAVVGPAPIPVSLSSTLSVVNLSREGYLRVLATATPLTGNAAARALAQWPESGHDAHNTGNLEHDGERPYPPRDLEAADGGSSIHLRFVAPGDDRDLGRVDHYEARLVDGLLDAPSWSDGVSWPVVGGQAVPAGSVETLELAGVARGSYTVMLRARDEAGNGSAVAVAQITLRGWRRTGARVEAP